ncbi:hypothetical protein SBOR_5868 [Sclerotinia borealis F-4128]|uniref:Extracellular serine-rich protein n=1 Tax=Sclerotinia borealis (strain F-4128) TaxID=1432307 RepID=W9CCZ0_SCLBF|nr:hypothetical protein SBOR_5868 [Sclerotinia borealis F-4128]
MMLLGQFGLLGLSILASVRAESSLTTAASASKSSSDSSALGSDSSRSSSTSTSSSAAATHTVSVGADGINYSPVSLTADVGDIIEFRFYPQNHSVARAEYKLPCIPYEDTGAGKVGFWSGFEPIAIVSNNPPTYSVVINDTEPIFFYCSSPGACQEGMVGVINPNDTQTFDTQLAYAQNATLVFSPNEYFPAETSKATTGSSATATSASDSNVTSSHKPFPPGAIAGIVVGAVAVIALAGALFYMCGRHRMMKEVFHNGPSNGPQTNNAFDNNHNSYMSQGGTTVSEANYPNMTKFSSGLTAMDSASGRFSPHNGAYTETDANSFRSRSPPIDETGMQTVRNGQYQSVSVGSPMGSPGFPSPAYNHEAHLKAQPIGKPTLSEMDDRTVQEAFRTQEKQKQNQGQGPIELPVPSRSASMTAGAPSPERERPFSYTDSESGYVGMMRSEIVDKTR